MLYVTIGLYCILESRISKRILIPKPNLLMPHFARLSTATVGNSRLTCFEISERNLLLQRLPLHRSSYTYYQRLRVRRHSLEKTHIVLGHSPANDRRSCSDLIEIIYPSPLENVGSLFV
jgi:hypothetical protein